MSVWLHCCLSHPACKSQLRRIILSPAACLAVPFFPHYLINDKIYEKKVVEHKMCVYLWVGHPRCVWYDHN